MMPTTKSETPFEQLVSLHLRLLSLQANANSEVSAGEDAASSGDSFKAEQHFRTSELYRLQIEDVSADIQKRFDSAPELRLLNERIKSEAQKRYGAHKSSP